MRALVGLLLVLVGLVVLADDASIAAPVPIDSFEAIEQRRPQVIHVWMCGRLPAGSVWCARRRYGTDIMQATPFGPALRWRSIVSQQRAE